MLPNRKRWTSVQRPRRTQSPRRLRVEPLESRTVLSILGFGLPVLPAVTPLETLPLGLAVPDSPANLMPAKAEFLGAEAMGHGEDLESIDGLSSRLSESSMERGWSGMPGPGPATKHMPDEEEFEGPEGIRYGKDFFSEEAFGLLAGSDETVETSAPLLLMSQRPIVVTEIILSPLIDMGGPSITVGLGSEDTSMVIQTSLQGGSPADLPPPALRHFADRHLDPLTFHPFELRLDGPVKDTGGELATALAATAGPEAVSLKTSADESVSLGTKTWAVNGDSAVRAGQEAKTAFAQTSVASGKEMAPSMVLYDASPASPMTSLARSRPSALEHAPEGGLIDIGPEASSGSTARMERVPPLNSVETPPQRDVAEPARRDTADQDRPLDEVPSLADEPTGKGTEEGPQPNTPAQDVKLAFGSDEGGTIDLIAAAGPTVPPVYDSLDLPQAPSEEPSLGPRTIPMDKGLGLFHAFELATVPTQRTDGPDIVSAETNQEGLSAETGQPAPTADAPAPEESVSVPGEQSLHGATAAPALILASLMTRRAKTLGRRSKRWAARLWSALVTLRGRESW